MSRLGRAAFCAALVTFAPRLVAQDAARWRDSAEVLAAKVRALRDSMLQGDSTVREVARRGDLIIGASEDLRGSVAEAFERFVQARNKWFGGASPSADGFRIVLRSAESMSTRWPFDQSKVNTVVLAGLPDTGSSRRTERGVLRRQLGESLIDLYGEMMWASAGRNAAVWLELAPPITMAERERQYFAMYAVVTGSGLAQRRCAAGSLPDCAYALGLRAPASSDPGGTFPAFVRADLLLSALELGGPEAWQRFRAAVAPRLEPALAAAAAMPIDSLLARWRSRLLALRPMQQPIEIHGALLALGWTTLLLLGALGAARWA